jgi:prepilin-type N-terminal cleavage/methylation domain-containing protein
MPKFPSNRRQCRPRTVGSAPRGFTLVEVLLVVAVIGILSGVAIVAVTNTRESTRVSKLQSDVATINAAIQVYTISGGALPVSATPQAILDKLKTSASAATASTIAGLRGSVIDRRLTAEMQTSDEGAGSQTRALWNGTTKRFVVATSGATGVKNFLLDDALAAVNPGTEARTATVKVGGDGWVWNYTDVAPTASSGAGTAPGTLGDGTNPTLTAPNTLPLDPPTFLPTGGSVALVNFDPDLPVTLSNPNSPGTSQIYYSMGGSAFALYTGQTLSVAPNASITAYAKTSDPDHWTDSNPPTSQTYRPIPVTLSISLNVPAASLTYAQAGGAMTSGATQTPAPATVTLNSLAEIPGRYLDSSKFQIYYTLDGTSPLTTGTAGSAFPPGSFVSPSIPVSLANWGSASSLVISAAARAIDTSMFISSPVVTSTIGITPTSLTAPVIDPASGSKAVDYPVSIALATGATYPTGARIYYTIDGTDPGNVSGEPSGGTLYTGSFNAGAGTDGVVVVTARVYGPAGYGQWFTPSAAIANTYNSITLADGALVGSATLNGTFVGSLVYATPSSGTMNSITFNSNASILGGNIYLPGTPTVRRTNGTVWSVANDSLFSSVIQGWEFDSSGAKTVQTTPRVIDETGSATPNNYSVTFNNSALLEGKVVRRHTSPAFPVIAAPPSPDSSGSISLNSPPAGAISASQYSTITLNSSGVGNVSLNAGHFGNLTANNGTAFVLGDPNNPDVTQVYSFQSLTLNSSSDLKVVGKCIVTVAGTINLNSGSVLGDSAHPEWLQLQFSSGSLNANSGSTIYGQLVDPTGSITFNSGSTFSGSVTTNSLTINSDSVVFSLPPVIQN